MAITIKSNNDQGVNLGATANLSGSNLQAISSKGTPNSRIQYTITSLPAYGMILRGNIPLSVGATFTQADLVAGNIRYRASSTDLILLVHLGVTVRDLDDPTAPAVSVEVPIRITIPPVPPNGTTRDMFVPQNGTTVATQSNIDYDDLNTPGKFSQIIFQVLVLPEFGTLMFNGKRVTVGTTFTQDDVNKGKLSYVHKKDINPLADKDMFIFQARDAQGNITPDFGVVNINIGLTDAPLTIVRNGPLNLDQDEKKAIGNDLLRATDEDDPNLVVTFTIKVLPKNGVLARNNVPLVVGSTFTQTDIDNGLLSYDHDGGISVTDSFTYDVAHTKNKITDTKFLINIKPVPNNPPLFSITPIPVDFCKSVVIDKTYVSISDPENKPTSELIVTITALPKKGTLFIKGVAAKLGDTLTAKDIMDNAALSYTHGCADPSTLTDPFSMTVSDGKNTTQGLATIIINYVKNDPPYLTLNKPQTVERVSSSTIDKNFLDFTDDDSPPEAVTLTITKVPAVGLLKINGVTVTVGRTFTKTEWNTVSFTYDVNTTDLSILDDSFEFTLKDEVNEVPELKYMIKFPPPPVGCPDLTNNLMKMNYKTSKLIDQNFLFAVDAEVKPVNLVFTITKIPQYGDLTFYGLPLGSTGKVTVRDIMNNALSYVHKIGNPEQDTVEMELTNGVCKIAVVFVIEFERSLFKIVNNPLVVRQSEQGVILGGPLPPNPTDIHLLFENKNSTDPSTIAYTIKIGTAHGKILVNGVETPNFTQRDLDDGLVVYQNDGSEIEEDSFVFSVTNGVETIEETFEIIIIMVDQPPVITNNGLTVGELACATINSGNLSAYDKESVASKLVFTVVDLPVYGTIAKNGVAIPVGGTFTYEDILNGFITYCHTAEDELTDKFVFTLSDEVNPPVGPEDFLITVIPLPEPALINRTFAMGVCSERTITSSYLGIANFSSNDDPALAVFTTTRLPNIGILKKNGVAMTTGDSFSLKDLREGAITYQNDTLDNTPQSFDFDLVSEDVNESGTFNIVFNASFNPPWVCVNGGMTVVEKTTNAIPTDSLQMCDIDLDESGEFDYPNMSGFVVNNETANNVDRYINFLKVDSGKTYTYEMQILEGSASVSVTDILTNKLVSTNCLTAGSTGQFTIPKYVYEVLINVSVGCSGAAVNRWNLSFTG